jgi:hypothetical protein
MNHQISAGQAGEFSPKSQFFVALLTKEMSLILSECKTPDKVSLPMKVRSAHSAEPAKNSCLQNSSRTDFPLVIGPAGEFSGDINE